MARVMATLHPAPQAPPAGRASLPHRRAGFLLLSAAACLAIHLVTCAAESTNVAGLTVDRIFTSGEFSGEGFGSYRWRQRGPGYTSLESPADHRPGRDLVVTEPESGEKRVLVPAEAFIPPGEHAPLSIEEYTFSDDESKLLIFTNSKRVWRTHSRGDYWVLDIAARYLRKLGGDAPPSTLQFATFSPDATRVAYVQANNLYVQHLVDLRIIPLTRDGSNTLINGTFDWVYEEELFLRHGFRWSPDGGWIAYWQANTEGVPLFHLLRNTDGLYPQIVSFPYPKVGEQNAAVRCGVVSAAGGETRWLSVPGDPREHYLARMDWAGNSKELLLQQFNRLQNTNRVWLAEAETGEVRTLLTETDPAWVENENLPWWIEPGREFLWLGERSGWRQAYRVSLTDGRLRRLTRGRFDITDIVALDRTNRCLYFLASPTNATQRYLYRVPFRGGKARRVTPADQPGTHRYGIAPDGRWAVHTYSTFGRPPVTDLVRLPGHERVRWLAENLELRAKLDTPGRPSHEFFRVTTAEGVTLDGWCLKPPDFDPTRRYPVIFHVYGEPQGQTVVDQWGGSGLLWHWLLAQQGYLVMSVDNRGAAAPRGRAFRKSLFRKIGILSTADQADAVRAIVRERPYVDPQRVAVWGWSGGGSLALNALFQYPETYQAAISVAPVPNQRYYDTIYQERYMGLPGDNPDGYRLGSPITHAHRLRGHLLLVHGTGDDNVHYQGSEALINELVAHNKPFTMMAYPNRTHGISEGHNTTRHLYRLMTDFLLEHLPPGPR